MTRLAWLKEAMHTANHMLNVIGKDRTPEISSAGDKAGLAMKAARALERGHWSSWDRCAAQNKDIRELLPPGCPRGEETVAKAVARAKGLATRWAREEVLLDLQDLVDHKDKDEAAALSAKKEYLEETV